MLRSLSLVAVLAAALVSLPGCKEKAATNAKDFQADVDKGKRPEPTTKREPPGPGKTGSGFQKGDTSTLPPGQQTPPPPPGKSKTDKGAPGG